MKILHVCIASAFTEGMTYQENLLIDEMCRMGHEVTVVSDANMYDSGSIIEVPEGSYKLDCGAKLIRKKYINFFGKFVSSKIRAIKGLYDLTIEIEPDVIFHHGLQSYEMLTLRKYVKKHKAVKFYVDSHEDFHNSATNWLSKNILHKLIYKIIIQKTLPYIDKVLCVSSESFEFLNVLYKIPLNRMEYYPLGGVIFDENERVKKRNKIRKQLGIDEEDILLLHSGKMDELKRTAWILNAMNKVPSDLLKLVLIGSTQGKVKEDVISSVETDNRIMFLGWKNGNELMDFLHACDVYIQPGSQSATMQNAACAGAALALFSHESHKYLFGDSVIYVNSEDDIVRLLHQIINNKNIVDSYKQKSFAIAVDKLDYRKLAERVIY